MSSTQESGVSSNRVKNVSVIRIDLLECSICHAVLWKPVACQSCETPFCSGCIDRWFANNPNQCPNQCETYTERKCPPFIAKLLAELQITCFYQSNGCEQIVSYEALDKHEIECGYRTRTCPACRSQILKKDFKSHAKNCPSVKLTCKDCRLIYRRSDATTKHTENICLKKQLQQLREECRRNKFRMRALAAHVCGSCMLNPSLTKARIIFDDLRDAIETEKCIPTTYRGLKWTGIDYAHESFLSKQHPASGYVTAFIPGGSPHVAYFADDASIHDERPNGTFTFVSITACAAWNDDLELCITGDRNSVQINTYTATLLFGRPQLILLQWKNIDKITFKPSGGTAHPGTESGAGSHVVVTQLTIDPFE